MPPCQRVTATRSRPQREQHLLEVASVKLPPLLTMATGVTCRHLFISTSGLRAYKHCPEGTIDNSAEGPHQQDNPPTVCMPEHDPRLHALPGTLRGNLTQPHSTPPLPRRSDSSQTTIFCSRQAGIRASDRAQGQPCLQRSSCWNQNDLRQKFVSLT